MEAFPAFFPLAGRRVVIAGEGEGAEAKARLFAGSPAGVERIAGAAALGSEAYAGALLAFVTSADPGFRGAAAAAAKLAGVPVNVVDDAGLSDFHTPALIDRGQVVAAIGTAGAAPIVAALLRAELDAAIPQGLGRIAALFGRLQPQIRAAFPDLARRRAFLRAVLYGPAGEAADAGDLELAERRLKAQMLAGDTAFGGLWLVAAPAIRDLLSLRAARALATADVLALEADLGEDIAGLARRDAHRLGLDAIGASDLTERVAAGQRVVVVAGAGRIGELAVELAARGDACEVLQPAPPA
ncbi:MAG TPA: bifunctional precorrin-2 dehydrogenase/sirohydrochlorin ferrochelatase [Caulobacteraceae bacterium]|nr:bifunctional precorrin-2 dehydrogenase/sirohydrochlorin ferrochelatase [Caulobacteraceae bacterium]